MKRRTKGEMAVFAETLYKERQEGAQITELAIKHGCHHTNIRRALKNLKEGKYDELENDDFEKGVMECIKEHDPGFIEVKVFADDGDNYIDVRVQKPDIKDVDEYELELKKRIAEKLSFSVETKFQVKP